MNYFVVALCFAFVHILRARAQGLAMYPSVKAVNADRFQLLVINVNQLTEVSLNCSIQPATSQDAFTNAALCLSGAAANSTDWTIQPSTVTVPRSTSFSILSFILSTTLTSRLAETLVVWCCNTAGLSASARIDVDVQPNLVRNANFTVPASATLFPNPAYQNIAPCSCDLTVGSCDFDCCCDADCTNISLSTFQCAPGAFGGNFTTDDFQLCSTQQFAIPDWHQFMCVARLNSPDLGLFYANVTGRQNVLTAAEISSLQANTPAFTFASDNDGISQPTQTTGYRNGDPIQIQTLGQTGYLTIPQVSLTGQCLRNALVQFQNESSAHCDVVVSSSANCLAQSVLDFGYYVTNTTVIRSSPGGESATVTVSYLKDTDASKYVKTNTGTSTSGGSLFGPATTASTLQNATAASPVAAATTCNDAVVSVTYVITWEANFVRNVAVEVILADVPLTDAQPTDGTTPNNVLSQSFVVRSTYITPPTLQRSGNPGYEVGMPVISGSQATSTTPVDATRGLRVWQPGTTGLCAENATAAPSFGRDSSSGCLLRLSTVDFADCAALRTLVEDNQRLLVDAATLLARYGNPNLTNHVATEWVTINSNLSAANATNGTVPGQCDNIPAQVNIEFVTSLSGRIEGFPITEIVAARVSWTRETWTLQCGGGGACLNANLFESFGVYSTVSFTSVPASGFSVTNECDADSTCWPELLFPLTNRFYNSLPTSFAERDFEYNLGWSVVVIFFALGAALLSLNWGKVGEIAKSVFPV